MRKPQVYTDLEIARVVSFFPNWKRFRRVKNHKAMTRQIVLTNRIDEFFPGELRQARGYDLGGLKLLVDTFDSIMGFLTAYPSIYAYINKHNLEGEVYTAKHLERVPPTEEEAKKLLTLAAPFITKTICFKKNIKLYRELKKNGLLDEAFPAHTQFIRAKSLRKYSLDKLRALIAKYPNLTEFHAKNRRPYEYIIAHDLQSTLYPKGYTIEHLTDHDISSALRAASESQSGSELELNHPLFIKYLKNRNIDPQTLVGLPFETLLELINSLRTKRKVKPAKAVSHPSASKAAS